MLGGAEGGKNRFFVHVRVRRLHLRVLPDAFLEWIRLGELEILVCNHIGGRDAVFIRNSMQRERSATKVTLRVESSTLKMVS